MVNMVILTKTTESPCSNKALCIMNTFFQNRDLPSTRGAEIP